MAQKYLSNLQNTPLKGTPTIFVGYVESGNVSEVRIAVRFNGTMPFNQIRTCSIEQIRMHVHNALADIIKVLKNIGVPRFRIANGRHFLQGLEPTPCNPVAPSIVGDLLEKLLFYVNTFLRPAVQS